MTESTFNETPREMVRPRFWVLPIAAVIIAGLVVFKLSRPAQQAVSDWQARPRPAPTFAALDSRNQLVKFERYLGRQEVLLVFFDGELGADRDQTVKRIRDSFDSLKQRGIQVVAVSTALPQQNRQAAERSGPFPFPLLSDPEFYIHKLWGRLSDDELTTRTGVFFVDRAGRVAWSKFGPQPVSDLNSLLPEPSLRR